MLGINVPNYDGLVGDAAGGANVEISRSVVIGCIDWLGLIVICPHALY